PGRAPPERAAGGGRAGGSVLRVRQPLEPRQAESRRERAVEPWGARRVGRAGADRRGAGRVPGAWLFVRARGSRGRGVLLSAVCLGRGRAPAPVLAGSPQGATPDGRGSQADGDIR